MSHQVKSCLNDEELRKQLLSGNFKIEKAYVNGDMDNPIDVIVLSEKIIMMPLTHSSENQWINFYYSDRKLYIEC